MKTNISRKLTKHEIIAKRNIMNAINWIVGGYYNDIQDGCLEYLPSSMQELEDEIYRDSLVHKFSTNGVHYNGAPKEMRFAGETFCRNLIHKKLAKDSDVAEIAETMGWK